MRYPYLRQTEPNDPSAPRYWCVSVGKNFATKQNFGVLAQTRSEVDLMSGLCCVWQLEIGVQAARKAQPDLSDDALLELAKTVRGFS